MTAAEAYIGMVYKYDNEVWVITQYDPRQEQFYLTRRRDNAHGNLTERRVRAYFGELDNGLGDWAWLDALAD